MQIKNSKQLTGIFHLALVCVTSVTLLWTIIPTKLNAIEIPASDLQAIDLLSPNIDRLTSSYLAELSKNNSPQLNVEKSDPKYLDNLALRVAKAIELSSNSQATFEKQHAAHIIAAEVHHALPDIRLDIDSKNTAVFIQALLNANDIKTAKRLSKEAFENASYLTSAAVHFKLAAYYFGINDIQNTLSHLLSIDAQEALSKDEQDYATLMLGVTLQKQKKHREALKTYKKITSDSYYFEHSRLNKAIAFILQGWWTDAELAVKEAFKKDKNHRTQLRSLDGQFLDLENRTLLFLAYSQLKYEYYRNARNSLRKISLDSQYVNKALLAMGLAALNQKDFLGAINAFTRLKAAKTDELSKTEAYLMTAFTYESMGDLNEAEKLYTEALAFFSNETLYWQKKIRESKENPKFLDQVEKYRFDPATMQKFFFLNKINSDLLSPTEQKLHQNIQSQFNTRINNALVNHYQQQIRYIESYQSQSQYALARLYDANQ